MSGTSPQTGAITLAAVTANAQTSKMINPGARGVKVVVVTSAIGTGSITVTIQGYDKPSDSFYTLLAGVAIITNTTNIYTVYPGLPAAANVTASDVLPETWRVLVTSNNANPVTGTVGWSTLA